MYISLNLNILLKSLYDRYLFENTKVISIPRYVIEEYPRIFPLQ